MITVEDFRKLEHWSGQHGVSSSMLMERAGKSFYEYLKKHLDLSAKTAIVFAGQGNNAGDGFVLARLLSKDCFVFVFLYGDEKKFSGDSSAAFTRIQGNDHVDVLRPDQIDTHTLKKIKATDHLLVIDALFGIGFAGQMPVEFTTAIDLFNSLPGHKVALDVPSGVNAVTGEIASFVCKPDLTLTLHEKKPGLMGLKNVTIVPLTFAPEAVQMLEKEITKRGPFKNSPN